MCASSKENIDLTILHDEEAFIVVRVLERREMNWWSQKSTTKNLKEKTYLWNEFNGSLDLVVISLFWCF